ASMRPSRSPVRKRPMTGPTERVYPPGYSSACGITSGSAMCSPGVSGGQRKPKEELDRALAAFPVRVAQLPLQQLAGRLARQLVDEVDAARPLVLAQPLLDVFRDRRAQRFVARDAFDRLDDRLDLLAHVVVGDAEHRDVGDLRVLVDRALDLGRVD